MKILFEDRVILKMLLIQPFKLSVSINIYKSTAKKNIIKLKNFRTLIMNLKVLENGLKKTKVFYKVLRLIGKLAILFGRKS